MAVSVYEKSVFINCPFDESFQPLFLAIVLTVAARGFIPRCALETQGQARLRMSGIAKGILEAKYSIHDLSRFKGEGAENLGRFNMPLELGMSLGIQYLGDLERRTSGNVHNWVALVPENFVHQKFISDLAGYDPPDHDQQPVTVIRRVATWLGLQPDVSLPSPSAKDIFAAYPGFVASIEQAKLDALGDLTWPAITKTAETAIAGIPVIG